MSLESNSKFLSLVLRHAPEKIGLTLDEAGWADIETLVRLANQHGRPLSRVQIVEIVESNDKKRFAISADGRSIRASQGHSVSVDLGLPSQTPPETLYHGTATRFLESIRAQGLVPGARQHVHLSADIETATKVGQRHGKPTILIVSATKMHEAGHRFYLSENGVWLTDTVPTEFLTF